MEKGKCKKKEIEEKSIKNVRKKGKKGEKRKEKEKKQFARIGDTEVKLVGVIIAR